MQGRWTNLRIMNWRQGFSLRRLRPVLANTVPTGPAGVGEWDLFREVVSEAAQEGGLAAALLPAWDRAMPPTTSNSTSRLRQRASTRRRVARLANCLSTG